MCSCFWWQNRVFDCICLIINVTYFNYIVETKKTEQYMRFIICVLFCLSKSKLTILKQTKTRVKNMNKNIKGLKTYIIRKKKKNSLVSVVWKKFKIKVGKSALSKWRLPGVLGKSQTKESATKDELVFFFLIFVFVYNLCFFKGYTSSKNIGYI